MPPLEKKVEKVNLVMYAGASGDFNPIHWDDEFARAVGLPGVIAHGMYTMAQAARALTRFAGGVGRLRSMKVRFSAMVRPGDTLTVKGRVAEVLPDGNARVEFWAEIQDGTRVLSGGEAVLA